MQTLKPVDTVSRIETNRKLRHITQTALAANAGISISMYTKVVGRHKRLTPQFVAACARAMGMDVSELYGQPFKDQLLEDKLSDLIRPISHVLDLYDLDPDEDIALRPYRDLRRDVAALGDLHDAGAFGALAQRLPALIEETRRHAVTTGNPAAFDLLAQAYRAVYDVGVRFGYLDLARIAMDRVDWAAMRAGDKEAPLRAMRQYQRALIHMKRGEYATGLKMAAAGRAMIDAVEDRPLSLAVRGQLMLGAALLSARSGAKSEALDYLEQAERIAASTGPVRAYWMGWGPTNVDVHRVAVWADLSEPGHAVTTARAMVLPEDWAPSRVARYWVTVAGAELWAGHSDRSLEALHQARHAAPQAVRYNPDVKDTVAAMTRGYYKMPPNAVIAFANWVGFKP